MKGDPLPQEASDQRVDVLAGGANLDLTLLRRVGACIMHELRGALPPTIFFFVGFNFIVLTTNLLVADYAVAVSNFMLVTVAALVVGKAVITANAMPFLKLFDRAPLIQPILFKTTIYWIATFLARLADRSCISRSLTGTGRRFRGLSDLRLLVAPLQRHLPLDTRVVPDLCNGVGIHSALGSGRNAEADVRPQAIRAAVEQAPARSRTTAALAAQAAQQQAGETAI